MWQYEGGLLGPFKATSDCSLVMTVCSQSVTVYECEADLLFGCYVGDSAEAVVLREGMLMEQHPLWQA